MKKILGMILAFMLIATQSFAAITYTTSILAGPYSVGGKSKQVVALLNLAGTYETNGFTLTPASVGLSHFESVIVQGEDGYEFYYVASTGKVMAFQTATVTPSGTIAIAPHADSAGTPAGTNSAPALTMNAYVPEGTNSAPAFTGTPATISPTAALAASPRVTVYQGATTGLQEVYYDTATNHFVVATTAGYVDADAPAITVTGAAYTPAGSVAAPTFTGTTATLTGSVAAPTFTGTTLGTHSHASTAAFTGAATTAAALAEVGNGTSLASVDKVTVLITGW